MEIKTEEITSLLKQQLDDYKIDIDVPSVLCFKNKTHK